MPFLAPAGREALAESMLQPRLLIVRMANPDNPMPGAAPSKGELAAKRKTYREVVDVLTRALTPHGLESVLGQPPLNAAVQQTIKAALLKTDTVVLITTVVDTTRTVGKLLGLPPDQMPSLPPLGNVPATQSKATRLRRNRTSRPSSSCRSTDAGISHRPVDHRAAITLPALRISSITKRAKSISSSLTRCPIPG